MFPVSVGVSQIWKGWWSNYKYKHGPSNSVFIQETIPTDPFVLSMLRIYNISKLAPSSCVGNWNLFAFVRTVEVVVLLELIKILKLSDTNISVPFYQYNIRRSRLTPTVNALIDWLLFLWGQVDKIVSTVSPCNFTVDFIYLSVDANALWRQWDWSGLQCNCCWNVVSKHGKL